MDSMVKRVLKKMPVIVLEVVVIFAILLLIFNLLFGDMVVNKSEIRSNCEKMIEAIVIEDEDAVFDCFNYDAQLHYKSVGYDDFQQIFEFVDGKVVSYEFIAIYGERSNVSEGKLTYYWCKPAYEILTDIGKYEIRFSYRYRWDEWPTREGIANIIVVNENTGETKSIGRTYDMNN